MITLPEGLTARPLVRTDARAVFEVMAAQERHDVGEAVIEEADIVGDWQRPSFDLATSTVGVLDGERLVGYAEVSGPWHGDAAVHPEYRGRGIGTALAGWMRETARARGARVIGMPVPQGSPGDRLLEGLGYHVRWTSWVLELPPETTIPERVPPPGYTIRAARPAEHRAAWHVTEDAFLEWSDREKDSYEDWASGVVRRPGFEPWHLRVAVDPAGDVVGVAFLTVNETFGYVDKLATRADQRGLGLAQCLLVDAFAAARAHGCSRSELSTDSRTGALGLYEKVGMRVNSVWVHRGIEL